MRRNPLWAAFGLLVAIPALAAPPAPGKGAGGLAVDVFELKPEGTELRGALLSKTDDGKGWLIAVQRGWLEHRQPAFYAKYLEQETAARRTALRELRERIEGWEEARPDDRRLLRFLRDEKERVTKLRNGPDGETVPCDSRFTLVEVPLADVRRHTPATDEARQVALVAWAEEMKDVESRTAADLRAALKNDGIDVARVVNAVEWLPPRRDTDAQWAARRAIVEYEHRKPLDYQGTGDLFFPTGDGAKAPPLGELLAGMFKSQLGGGLLGGNLLDLDLFGDAPKKPAASSTLPPPLKGAEREGVSGVRITSVEQDLAARRVTVRATFWARVPVGELADLRWEPVFQWTETADASKPRPDAEGKIEKDPQVKQALGLISSILGGGDADQTIRMAIRHGAAVMEAQQAADARFYRFRDTYLKSLEGPPLNWSPKAAAGKP